MSNDTWIDRRRKYAEKDQLGKQKAEDMIARRVYRGLGFSGNIIKGIREIEHTNFGVGSRYHGDPLWPRTLRILRKMLPVEPVANLDIHAMGCRDRDEAVDRLEMFDMKKLGKRPAIFARYGDSSLCEAVVPLLMGDAAEKLEPAYTVLASSLRADGFDLVAQELRHFIEQFEDAGEPLEI